MGKEQGGNRIMHRRSRASPGQMGGMTSDETSIRSRIRKTTKSPLNSVVMLSAMLLIISIMIGTAIFLLLALPDGGKDAKASASASSSSSSEASREPEIHVIVSTGCTTFQDWQSYVLFFHAWKSGQRGTVTRIASGCSEEDAVTLRKLHREQIEIISDRFLLHLTPDYARIKPGINFKYFNKPFGVRHWLENVMGYPNEPKNDDAIVMLIDPDQIIMRPFTGDFTNSTEVWRPKQVVQRGLKVTHGTPFATQYGFGIQWKTKVNMTYVAKGEPSRVDTLSEEEAKHHYSVGPPYLATARDMYKIAVKWTEFVPFVHDEYPHLLAEMFAYCLAAAHLNLPHRVAHGFMVSDVGSGAEGWDLVDNLPTDQLCDVPPPQRNLPHVLHYCQRYMLGKWFINKYRLRKDFISCESPLLRLPPPDIWQLDYQISPDGTRYDFRHGKSARRNAFMICQLIPRLNEAAEFFKKHHCEEGTANMKKTYIFHKSIEEDDSGRRQQKA